MSLTFFRCEFFEKRDKECDGGWWYHLDKEEIFYLDVMPKWQFEVYLKEKNLSAAMLRATNSMKWASWLMFAVALLSLFVAIRSHNIIRNEEKRKYKEERKTALICLEKELAYNIELAEEIIKKKEDYIQEKRVPFEDMIVVNLEKILSSNYIKEITLLDEVFEVYGFLRAMNNFLLRARYGKTAIEDIKNVIKSLEEEHEGLKNINYLKNLAENIKTYRNQIR